MRLVINNISVSPSRHFTKIAATTGTAEPLTYCSIQLSEKSTMDDFAAASQWADLVFSSFSKPPPRFKFSLDRDFQKANHVMISHAGQALPTKAW